MYFYVNTNCVITMVYVQLGFVKLCTVMRRYNVCNVHVA